MWTLTVRAGSREQAVLMYRYLQKVFLVRKEDVERVDDTSFRVSTRKEMGELMIRALKDKFEETI